MRNFIKKLTKQQRLLVSILSIAIIAGVFLIQRKPTVANQPLLWVEAGIDMFQKNLANNATNKRWVLKNFCTAAAATANGFTDGSVYYTPQYSVFLGILCKPLKIDTFFDDTYLPENIDKNRNKFPWVPSNCDPSSSTWWDLKNCDLSKLLIALFTATMNDHSALAMWWRAMSDKNIDNVIKNFSTAYFWTSICWDKIPYIGNKSVAWAEACAHPKTHKYLKDTITNFQKQIEKIQTLNTKKIPDITKDAENCVSENNEVLSFPNIFLCSYTSNTTPNQSALQSNILYNELMYYRILANRLILQYTNDNVWLWEVKFVQSVNTNSADITKTYSHELLALRKEIELSKKALTTTQKTIANFQASFPLHVWLLAYYEDILAIRKSFVKIYTPIHQLYYTLRNVQSQ